MKLANRFTKFFLMIAMWGVVFLPIFACQAASDLASVWKGERQAPVAIYMPINTEGIVNFGTFFVYLLIIGGGIFALSIIMIGALKMYMASGNQDAYYGARHAFVAGIISFAVAIVAYFSLDQVLLIVRDLAMRMV